MAERNFTTTKAAKAKHGRGKVVPFPHPGNQEKKRPTTEEMVNILRLTVFVLYHEIQKLKGDHDHLTIDQREVAEILGFPTTGEGDLILDEEFDQILFV